VRPAGPVIAVVILVAVPFAASGCGSSGSSSSSATGSTAALAGATGATGASGASGAQGPTGTGTVQVTYEKPRSAQDALGLQLVKGVNVEHLADLLAQNFELPHPLTVKAIDGVGGGPFYNPKDNSITLQYGFMALIFDVLKQDNPGLSNYELGFATGSVEGFILEHEFGHALIHNYDLPILGNEEDAADTIATILLLNSPSGAKLAAYAARFWADFSNRQSPPQLADYADVHSLDLQRADNIMCDVAGSSKAAFAEVARLKVLPASRLSDCPHEYQQDVDSIKQELDPYLSHPLNLG
jgi:Putative metallopeptidase